MIKDVIFGRKPILVECPWEWGNRNCSQNCWQAARLFFCPIFILLPAHSSLQASVWNHLSVFLNIPTAFPNHLLENMMTSASQKQRERLLGGPAAVLTQLSLTHKHHSPSHTWSRERRGRPSAHGAPGGCGRAPLPGQRLLVFRVWGGAKRLRLVHTLGFRWSSTAAFCP